MFSLNDASALAREPEVAAALEAVERYLAAASGPRRFRKARGADGAADLAAWRGLASIGIAGALVPEAAGGSGLPSGAALLIAERLGWHLAREPFVENVVLPVSLLLFTRGKILIDEAHCVAWQEGPFALPAASSDGTTVRDEKGGLRILGRKRFVMGARASTQIIVLAALNGEPILARVAASAPGVQRQDKVLADGTFWSDIAFDVSLREESILARGAGAIAALTRALDLANLALAGQLYGLQTRIFAMTLDYLGTRVQFDQPLGAFQALQHRAVDLYTHAQITRFLLGEAADALRAPQAGLEDAALASYASRAKARAVEAGLRIAREGIQMHGAIGFSDEYDLGLYVKRILVLSAWLGGAEWHRRRWAGLEAPHEELAA